MTREPGKMMLTMTLAALGLCVPVFGLGAEPAIEAMAPLGSRQFSNLGAGLVIVVFAIVCLGLLYAKTQGLTTGSNGVTNIVATQAIGPKERIAIVEVAGKQLLIGMTTSSVQTLHVFDAPVADAPEPRVSFADRLKSALKGAER